MRLRGFASLCAAVLVLAACSSPESTTSAESSTTSQVPIVEEAVDSTSTTAASTTTVVLPAVEDAPAFEVLRERDVEYLADDEGSWTMDVFYPSVPGDWPLVVVYHGMTTQRSITAANTIAASGAVAVAPQWLQTTSLTREEYIDGYLFDRAACATAVAQQIAVDFGADPTNTTVAGFSAGVHPAGWVGLGVVRTDVCDQPLAAEPVGLVLGDSQLIFYEEGWDESFADPSSNAEDSTDRFVNPDRWNVPDDIAAYLWSTDFEYGRTIEDPPADDSWIWARDTTGTLVDDFTALGAIESEWIGFMENGELLERRMVEIGIDATHDAVGGGHSYSEVVYEGIDELIHRQVAVSGSTAGNGFVWPEPGALLAAKDAVCAEFPDVGFFVHEKVNLVAVGTESWDKEVDEIVRGESAVLSAINAMEIASVTCGDDHVLQADYVAFPVSTVDESGVASHGMWVLKVTSQGAIAWINMYSGGTERSDAVASEPDALVAESRAFCGTIEGTDYRRDADEFLAFMAVDPAAQAIPNVYHVYGQDGIRSMIDLYPPGDDISWEDDGIASGVWTASGITLTHPEYTIYLEGIEVHLHTPEGIKDLYYHWTDAGMMPGWGVGTWGLPPNP
ncbi:MAG: hypothetical protein ACR2N9_06490 [Acidimicrobiia bacterium]